MGMDFSVMCDHGITGHDDVVQQMSYESQHHDVE